MSVAVPRFSKWATKPLGDVFEFVGGGTPSKQEPSYYGGDIPWATIRDMGSSHLSSTQHSLTRLGLANSSSKLIPAGEVIMATRVGLGKACILMQDTAINQDIRALIPLKDQAVDRRFLLYWLQSSSDEIVAAGTGATVQGVTLPFIRGLPFPSISVEQQKRIVRVLDQAFAALDRARANASANLADVTELMSSELATIFKLDSLPDDQVHAMAEVFSTATGNTPAKSRAEYYGSDIPFVKPPELTGGVVGTTSDSLSELGRASARLAPQGTVLVSCIGNLGKIGLLKRPCAFNQQINAILPTQRAIPEFVMYQCRSPQFMKQLERRAGGTTVSIVNKSQFNELKLWVPEVDTQASIVSKLKRLEEEAGTLRGRYSGKTANVAALRKSLLQAAFSGQMT